MTEEEARAAESHRSMLRGCSDCCDLLSQAVDWEKTSVPDFKEKWHRPRVPLESGE